MSATTVRNQLGVYFGGPYDAARRLYATPGAPLVAGLYSVRRGWPKRFDKAEFFYGAPAPVATGAMGLPRLTGGSERRVAVGGATSGVKKVMHDVEFGVWVYSTEPYAEDAYDAVVAMRDAIVERIRADRTCGSGGFEVGGFQVGEGGEPWIRWRLSAPSTHAEVTTLYLVISFEAHEYVQA